MLTADPHWSRYETEANKNKPGGCRWRQVQVWYWRQHSLSLSDYISTIFIPRYGLILEIDNTRDYISRYVKSLNCKTRNIPKYEIEADDDKNILLRGNVAIELINK